MPATENDRRNAQQPTLENPSLPDHDRTQDPGMHAAVPEELRDVGQDTGALSEEEIAPPDQEFSQILESGPSASNGLIHEDPNNWLTSDKTKGADDLDPENRGDSLADMVDGVQH